MIDIVEPRIIEDGPSGIDCLKDVESDLAWLQPQRVGPVLKRDEAFHVLITAFLVEGRVD